MAATLDASSPAQATGNTSGLATASFTAPANAFLLAEVTYNNSTAGAANNHTVTDSGGLTWTLWGRKSPDAGSTGGAGTAGGVEKWYATTASSAARTVSVAFSGGTSRDTQLAVKVYTDTGGAPTAGAIAAASSTSGLPSVSLTTTAPNSVVTACSSDWAQKGLGTAGTGQTITDEYNVSGQYTGHVWKQNAPTALSGTAVVMNLTAVSGEQLNVLAGEILANSSGGTNFNGAASASTTAAASAAGGVATSTGASASETATGTAAGSVAASTGASAIVTAGASAAGSVTATGAASTAVIAGPSAAGVVATSTGASETVTATRTAAGTVAMSTGAAQTVTAAATAAGTVTSGLSGSASISITATASAAGHVATSVGATVTVTTGATAAGVVGVSTGATETVTASRTAAGAVAASAGASFTATAQATAAGTVTSGLAGSATVVVQAGATASGVVATSSGAVRNVTAMATAAGFVSGSGGARDITISGASIGVDSWPSELSSNRWAASAAGDSWPATFSS